MTVEDAKKLNKGDYVFYNGKMYKVLNVKELRAYDTGEVYINIKCGSKNETLWLPNKFAEVMPYE